MSTSTARETPVTRPSGRRRQLVILLTLGIPLAFMSGTIVPEPASIALVIGVLTSFAFGLFFVAPRAGAIAKDRFLRSLAHPSPEDRASFQLATVEIVGNMAMLAKDEKLRKLYAPIFSAFEEALDASYKGLVNNIASQASRSAGAFDPSQYSEEEIGRMFEQEVVGKVGGVVDPFLETMGMTDRGKQIVHAKVMLALRGGGNGRRSPATAGKGSPSESPYQSQYR